MRKFDIGDEVFGISPSTGCYSKYIIIKTYDGDADYYIKAERISTLFPKDEVFMVDENLRAAPLTRKIIFEKWKQ